ncbi:photosystem II reaction center protein Psb28 [Chloropicon primus]|uniref:Photosystem II reaction center Psb28 protein n=1 Tax=Chloropicon primus TaxID=1764295 RepID=A0A5B8MZ40_9CHLO|nr:photosystem II reaction center protein Psb28 [Chloropicon primus]|eukprot:QDZ24945.1 photosystem II reaction center protein Psb28 [Chloropicon primus]
MRAAKCSRSGAKATARRRATTTRVVGSRGGGLRVSPFPSPSSGKTLSPPSSSASSSSSSLVVCGASAGDSAGACVMQFVRGVDEAVVPEVKLTRSRDGSNGVATFIFMKPTIFDNDADVVAKGEITGLYMIDEEGELQTQDVVASFLDGKPNKIEARYVMKSAFQWDRFMRFMERYANENGLGFNKA